MYDVGTRFLKQMGLILQALFGKKFLKSSIIRFDAHSKGIPPKEVYPRRCIEEMWQKFLSREYIF